MSYQGQDGGSTFMSHLGKWLQLRNMMDDMKYRKERREQDRQVFQLDLEERNRRRAHEDFKTARDLQGIGALPAEPGDTGKNDEAIAQAVNITAENRRRLIKTPVGNYRLPSETDRYARAKTQAAQKGTLKGIEGRAEADIENPYVPAEIETGLPAPFNRSTKTVREKDKAALLKTMHERANPNLTPHWTQPNDTGEQTGIFFDKQGNERKRVVVTAAGKTKTVAGGKEPLPSNAEVEALMKKWRQNAYNSRGITPDDQRLASGWEYGYDTETKQRTSKLVPVGPSDENRKAAQNRIDKVEKELRDAATQEVKARIRNGQAAGRTTRSDAAGGPVLPAANVAEAARRKALKMPALRKPDGTPDIEKFKQWFTQQGGVLQ